MQQLLCEYEIILVIGVKTSLPMLFPGYKSYRNKIVGSVDRGGPLVFVKNWLPQFVFGVDSSIGDQVWLQLRDVPGVLFGFCYILPSDSQYYSLDAFSSVKEKSVSEFMPSGYVVVGDTNTRVGKCVRELLLQLN